MADRIEERIEDCGSCEEHDTTVGHASSSTASKQVQRNNSLGEGATSTLKQETTEEDNERRPLLVVTEAIRVYDVIQVVRIEEAEKAEIAANVANCDRPSIDDIACIVQERQHPTYRYNDENRCLDVCCSPADSTSCKPACKYSFRITKLQELAVRKGMLRFIQFWNDGITPPWKFALVLLKIFIYLWLLIFALGSFVYHVTERRSIIPFDVISSILVVIGKIVAVTHAFVIICRHHHDIRLCCTRLCHPICGRCRRRHVNPDEVEEDQDGLDEAATYVMHMEQKLNRQKGNFALYKVVIGNFSEVLLTIADDAIGTVVIILSFYSFVGGQHFALFYGNLHWSRFFVFGRLVFSSILLLVTHSHRIFTVGKNIYRLDKKVDHNVRYLNLPLPNTFCKVLFSFQWRLVAHIALSSVFQLYAVSALLWKIIQDNCSPVSHPVPTASSSSGNGTVLPFLCDIPHFANGYTIYNILYIVVVPTLLGHITYFVCNAPSFVEYMQIVAIGSYRQMEKLITEEHGANGVEGRSPIIELVKVFCSDLDCSFSIQALRDVEERARSHVCDITRQLNADAHRDNGYFIRAIRKLFDSAFFLPSFLVGTLHLGLFLIHICFMTCTVNTCFDTVNIFSIIQHNAASELLGVIVTLATLFLLTSFPGPWISLFWIILPPTFYAILVVLKYLMYELMMFAYPLCPCLTILCCIYARYKHEIRSATTTAATFAGDATAAAAGTATTAARSAD